MTKYLSVAHVWLIKNEKAVYLLIGATFVWLRLRIPVTVLTLAGHDDALFYNQALHIVRGDWLGSFTHMTLAKGSGFGIFLAANYFSGFPITLTLALFYLGACLILARTLVGIGINRIVVLATFVIILFHPGMTPTRIIRDTIVGSLTLLLVSGLIRLLNVARAGHELKRKSLILSGLSGLALGWSWITREDAIWYVPAITILISIIFARARALRCDRHKILAHVSAYFAGALCVVAALSSLNFVAYGTLAVNDFNENSFVKVQQVLNSVQPNSQNPKVPVSREQRQKIYEQSPAFSELKDFLENPQSIWLQAGCETFPTQCDDLLGGWWIWALRDATYTAGHYATPTESSRFYNQIIQEVTQACESQDLVCQPSPLAQVPNMSGKTLQQIPTAVVAGINGMLLKNSLGYSTMSEDPLQQLSAYRNLLNRPMSMNSPSENVVEVIGWYLNPTGNWVYLACSSANGFAAKEFPVGRIQSPDLTAAFPQYRVSENRFSFTVSRDQDCKLIDDQDKSEILKFTADSSVKAGPVSLPGDRNMHIDVVNDYSNQVTYPFDLQELTREIYHWILQVLGIAALLAFGASVLTSVFQRRFFNGYVTVAVGLWVLIATRLVLLAMVDVSSFPAIQQPYLVAVYPVFVLACLFSIYGLVREESETSN